MTTVSYTGTIDTNGILKTVESETGITLTSGKSYTIQTQNYIGLKIADATFTLNNQIFTYTHGDDTLYIKTGEDGAQITILENA